MNENELFRNPQKLVDALRSNSATESNGCELEALRRVKTILNEALSVVTSQLSQKMKESVNNSLNTSLNSSQALLIVEDLQCLEPRGRFKLTIHQDSMFFEGKQHSFLISVNDISQVCCVPSHLSSKKGGEDVLSLHFRRKLHVINKETSQVLCNLNRATNRLLKSLDGETGVESEAVTRVLGELLQRDVRVTIDRPDRQLFQSAVNKGRVYLSCYRGTQEGALYPLHSGLLFLKPLLFLPSNEIAAITAGRGGGGATRYVDLRVEMTNETVFEFTNIEREELAALQLLVAGYVEARRKRMRFAVSLSEKARNDDNEKGKIKTEGLEANEKAEQAEQRNESDDSDNSDDEDYAPGDSDAEEGIQCSASSDDSSEDDSDEETDSLDSGDLAVVHVVAKKSVKMMKLPQKDTNGPMVRAEVNTSSGGWEEEVQDVTQERSRDRLPVATIDLCAEQEVKGILDLSGETDAEVVDIENTDTVSNRGAYGEYADSSLLVKRGIEALESTDQKEIRESEEKRRRDD